MVTSIAFRTGPITVDSALRHAASLVSDGLTAFLEGNAFRARRVQEAARGVQGDLDSWQERALSTWPDDEAGFEAQLLLAREVEALARAAEQLAGLATSRPAPLAQAGLRDATRRLAGPLEDILRTLADPSIPMTQGDVLGAMRQRRLEFTAWCAHLGRDNPRLFVTSLVAVAAGQRIQEAAEAATAAANLQALQVLA